MNSQTLRIGLKAYDSTVLDESCNLIMNTLANTNVKVVGPVPLPTKRRIYCVLRSPHVNKDAREHFEIRTHKRIIDVISPSEDTLRDLRNLDLAAGVEVEVKNS